MNKITINNETQCLVDVRIGNDVQIFKFVNAYGCSINDGTRVGSFVEIQKGATIGKNCKISSHSFICEGVQIADNVFIGHNVTFINDRYPRATNGNGELQTASEWTCENTVVNEGASLGSSVTVLCGVQIGRNAIVGAGSVVLKDIPENTIYAGNPAKFIKSLDKVTV